MNSKNSNTTLIVIIAVLSAIIILGVGILMISNMSFVKWVSVPTQQNQANEQTQTGEDEIYEETPHAQPTTMYVANVNNSIYLRSRPEEKSDNIITTIPLGAQVVWMSDETSVFSRVSYGGSIGYVKRDYLSATPPAQAQTNNTTIYKYMYVANVKNSIYLRSSAQETSNNIITTIPLGTKIGFIEYANNTFSKINYNGTIGYVKTMYLADYYNTDYRYMTVTNVKHSIYLRSAPVENAGNIICEIPVNNAVRYIENAGNGFYKISWNGYVGYSKSMYLR